MSASSTRTDSPRRPKMAVSAGTDDDASPSVVLMVVTAVRVASSKPSTRFTRSSSGFPGGSSISPGTVPTTMGGGTSPGPSLDNDVPQFRQKRSPGSARLPQDP